MMGRMGIRELFRRGGVVTAASALPVSPPPTAPDGWVSPWQAEPNYLGSALLAELYGLSTNADDVPVTRGDAMSVASFARARRVLCTTLGRTPLVTYAGRTVVDNPAAAGYANLAQPEDGRPGFITWTWAAEACWLYGRAWFVVVRRFADTGRPARFEWVPEWQTKLVDGQLVGHKDGRSFDAADVIRVDGPDEGVLNFGARSIRTALRLERAAARTSDNPVPTIDLHDTGSDRLDDAEIDALIDRFRTARMGSAIGYTSGTIEARPLAMDVEQLLIDGRRAAALDVARTCGVPAWVVDVGTDGSSLTYSNVPSRTRELIDFGVAPYFDAIAGRFSLDDVLPRGVWCRFDSNQLLRDAFADRMNAYKTAVESGVYTSDELREMEELPPLEGADE
jgi:hypothetical protein